MSYSTRFVIFIKAFVDASKTSLELADRGRPQVLVAFETADSEYGNKFYFTWASFTTFVKWFDSICFDLLGMPVWGLIENVRFTGLFLKSMGFEVLGLLKQDVDTYY